MAYRKRSSSRAKTSRKYNSRSTTYGRRSRGNTRRKSYGRGRSARSAFRDIRIVIETPNQQSAGRPMMGSIGDMIEPVKPAKKAKF